MKKLHYSTKFKKDAKKYRHQPKKVDKLMGVLRMLENEELLPPELKAHFLQGEYKGCMECHIEGDFLLIWFDVNSNIIEILRLGSHSELFKE
jgi:mRNA interferase YafQ